MFFTSLFIQQSQQLKADKTISSALRENLDPYMMEAILQPELLCGGRDVLIQGLLWYFVIDKRKRELDDIADEGNCNKIHMKDDITIILIIVTGTVIIIIISCYFYYNLYNYNDSCNV